jgi:TatD DNase family protein
MNPSLFDAHNHLQDARLAAHLPAIIDDCQAVGIRGMVVNGTCESDWPKVRQLARDHSFVVPSFGYHPWYLTRRSPNWESELNRHLDAVPSAVGEIGLDRWMDDYDFELQIEMFGAQLGIAAERNLPVTIHCLKAWGQLIELLETNPVPQKGFLLHSYGGSAEMIPRFAKLGAYFSVSGYFAHERKARQLENFRLVPPNRLLIETDAPDMWPPDSINRFPYPAADQPANHPANLGAIYDFTAASLNKSPATLVSQVEKNFRRIFGENSQRGRFKAFGKPT